MEDTGTAARSVYRFGIFELDSRTGELRKHGVRIKLQEQPLQILLLLLEHSGNLVSREQIQQRLWPSGTYVDYDNAINSAMRKLRQALCDTSENPRFIETLPRRGYRFLADIKEQSHWQRPAAAESADWLAGKDLETTPNGRKVRVNLWASATAIVFLAVLGLYFAFRRVTRPAVFFSSVPLTSYPGLEICPSFAPDGERVAFAWDGPKRDNFDIYVKQIGGGLPLRLTNDAEPDISPAWSPDGRSIAFLHVVGDTRAEVSIISALAPGPRRILGTVSVPSDRYFRLRFMAWSADGKWLAVSDALNAMEVTSLFLFSATESSGKGRLTFPPLDYDDFDPAFSPDMKYLAFIRYSSLGASASDLYLLRLTADLKPQGEPQRLTNYNRQIGSPVWTPDGRTILFSRHERGGLHSFWRLKIGGSRGIEPVPIPAENSYALALSPQGNRIVYTRDSENVNIWRVDLTSTGNQQRSGSIQPWVTSTLIEDNPQISPDGKYIAYQSWRSGTAEIWVCDRDGSNPRQLTSLGAVVSGFPRWSPDGKQIVFHSRVNGSGSLHVVEAAGGHPRQLTSGGGNDISPSWSNDGKWIYFASRRTGEFHIWKMPAGGGPATQLPTRNGWCPVESKDGRFLYYASLPQLALRKLPLTGGPETESVSGLAGYGSSFAPAKHGVYFIRAANHSKVEELAYFQFPTGRTKTIATIPGTASLGIALSPDERVILYGQTDQLGSDLMLVDHFH
jgi:Tol biopolymer transport system component/DNA-binding winged helix-turn-helix (wHTH) protein